MIRGSDLQNGAVRPGALAQRGEDEPNLSPSRLAAYWGVHVNTVYRDIRKGALRAFKLPGGQFRVTLKDARRYGRPVE